MTATLDPHAPSLARLDDGRVCPHCMEPVDPVSHFCQACGGPTSMHSAIDPMGQVYTLGYAYREATTHPTKFIIVLGVWLICLPMLLPLVFILIGLTESVFLDPPLTGSSLLALPPISMESVSAVLISLGLGAIYFLLLYKTTHAYVRARREARGLCPNCRYDLRGSRGQDTCPRCGCAVLWFEDEDEYPPDDSDPIQT